MHCKQEAGCKANAIALIGHTPMVALAALCPPEATLVAKVESFNPGGSVKDRAAAQVIDSAYAAGRLRPGQTVVEMTSGNMGAGLAVVCAVRGNPLVLVMSRGNSPERVRMLENLGAEVVLVDQVDGAFGQVTGADIAAATAAAEAIARERDGYYVDQFHNDACVEAHERGTGPEILAVFGPKLRAFVSVVGSGGTFVGVARFLKRSVPGIRCAAVEPEGCEVLAGKPVTKPRHLLQGTGYGSVPPHWEPALADDYLTVSDDEAVEYRRRLAGREGLYVGYSAAANVCAACKLIRSGVLGAAPLVATVLCDTGLKYS